MTPLTPANDLGHEAHAQRGPALFLILFSIEGCPYCEAVRREHLRFLPPRYQHWPLRVREIVFDRDLPLVDFSGRATTTKSFARELRVRFAPTVVLFTDQGARVGKPLVGRSLADFYDAYVAALLDEGAALLSKRA